MRIFKYNDECDKLAKMNDKLTVTGKIVSGEKKGAFFTQLDWVQNQCQEKLGFKPFPGTLNLEIDTAMIPQIEALLKKCGMELVPPDPNFCAGHVYPVNIMGVGGAIVAPAEDVRVHSKNILELIAPTCLKEAMDVDDEDLDDEGEVPEQRHDHDAEQVEADHAAEQSAGAPVVVHYTVCHERRPIPRRCRGGGPLSCPADRPGEGCPDWSCRNGSASRCSAPPAP